MESTTTANSNTRWENPYKTIWIDPSYAQERTTAPIGFNTFDYIAVTDKDGNPIDPPPYNVSKPQVDYDDLRKAYEKGRDDELEELRAKMKLLHDSYQNGYNEGFDEGFEKAKELLAKEAS